MSAVPVYIEVREIGPREWIVNRVFPTTRRKATPRVFRQVSEAQSFARRQSARFGGVPVIGSTYRDGS